MENYQIAAVIRQKYSLNGKLVKVSYQEELKAEVEIHPFLKARKLRNPRK